MVSETLLIPYDPKPITCIYSNPPESACNARQPATLIFTHGAGGTLSSPGIANFSSGFSRQLPILCFQGNSSLTSRTKMFRAVVDHQKAPNSLGGRSMGARAAAMAATPETKRLVLVSYPLHTAKETRDQILLDIDPSIRVIFVIGDRDSMCDLERLDEVRSKMRCQTWRIIVQGADHGMDVKPKKLTEAVGMKAGRTVAEWMEAPADVSRREGRIICNENGEVQWTGWMGADDAAPMFANHCNDLPKDVVPPKAISRRPYRVNVHSEGKISKKTSTKSKSISKRPKPVDDAEDVGGEPKAKRPKDSKQTNVPTTTNGEAGISTRTRSSKRRNATESHRLET
ncbi:MAG: hypothetical protein Q9209_004466 [Squamulea sp. 1 TL-2023]